MPFNLLLFPLVGGYFIISHSEWFRYKTQRLESERLIFNSVIAGCVLLCGCWFLKSLSFIVFEPQMIYIKSLMPIKQDYFGVTLISFFISIVLVLFANLFIDEKKQISLAIDNIGSDLEKMLKFSAEERELILVTLSNDKVYVGICARVPVPDRTTYFRIIPFFSGYRDSGTKDVVFTTDYLDVYGDYIKEGKAISIEDLQMEVLIKTEELITCSRFNIETYDRFYTKANTQTSLPSSVS